MNISLLQMQQKLAKLEHLMENLQDTSLFLFDVHHLQDITQHRKDKIYNLLFHANVPYFWIVDVNFIDTTETKVKIQCINTLVRNVIYLRLQKYIEELSTKHSTYILP